MTARPNPPPNGQQPAQRPEGVPEKVKRGAQAARVRNLERALLAERTAHIAIARVVLDTADEPARFVQRIEALAGAVVRDKRTPRATKEACLAARDLFRRTVEQRTGRPQQLFEPDVGHVAPAKVDAIAGMSEAQLSIDDARDAHNAIVAAEREVQAAVLAVFERRPGPVADPDLWDALRGRHLTQDRIYYARVALSRTGRLVRAGDTVRDGKHWPTYTLIERTPT